MVEFERLKRIYNQFDPHQLPTKDEYVDFDEVRSEPILGPLMKTLQLANPEKPIARLFAGGRGAGKTTELRRFEDRLKKANFVAIYVDVESLIDINRCDFNDFFIAIAVSVSASLKALDIPGYGAIEHYVNSKFDEVIGFFTQKIKMPGGEISSEIPGLKGSLKFEFERNPSSSALLSDQMDELANHAVKLVGEAIAKLHQHLIERNYGGLVLLVDGGDKIVPFQAGKDQESQHSKIFANRATQLCNLACHVVYSVPLSFCYSPSVQHFNATSGALPIVLPMTSLRPQKTEAPQSSSPGFGLFLRLIKKRLESVNEKVEDVFDWAILEKIIFMSGGNPTALMTIIQSTLVRLKEGEWPVSDRSVDNAIRTMANELNRAIPSDYWDTLRSFDSPQQDPNKTEIFMNGLYYQFIYEYLNGGSWFEVNPILRTLGQFSS